MFISMSFRFKGLCNARALTDPGYLISVTLETLCYYLGFKTTFTRAYILMHSANFIKHRPVTEGLKLCAIVLS